MNLQKTILAVAAILMAVFILTLGSSCGFSKDVNKTQTSTKLESRTDDSLKIETLKNEVAELSRQIREMENQEFTFQTCPEIDSAGLRNGLIEAFKKDTARLNEKIDSLIAVMNKKPAVSSFKKDKDGNTEVTGPLKSVKTSTIREEQMTLKYTAIIQNLIESHVKTAATMMTKKEEKEKHSKGGFLNLPWLWIVLAALGGGYLGWRLRGGIKMIDKLNPTNMKNLLYGFMVLILLSGCGKSAKPDNYISDRSARHTGWATVNIYTDPVPVYDSFYYTNPTWQQSNRFAAQRSDHGLWNAVGFAGLALLIFFWVGIGTNLISWFPKINEWFAGLLSLALVGGILWAFKHQASDIKENNKVEISKARYNELMQRDGSIQAFWDSLENGCHITFGKSDCWDKDNKPVK